MKKILYLTDLNYMAKGRTQEPHPLGQVSGVLQ